MKKDKEVKLDKNSELVVTRKEVIKDAFGRTGVVVKRLLTDEDISLGSINNPKNTDLIEFEWREKDKKNIFGLK